MKHRKGKIGSNINILIFTTPQLEKEISKGVLATQWFETSKISLDETLEFALLGKAFHFQGEHNEHCLRSVLQGYYSPTENNLLQYNTSKAMLLLNLI